MMRAALLLLALALAFPLNAQLPVKSYGQELVDQVVARNPGLLVIVLHVSPPNVPNYPIIASNIGRIGKLADDDDMRVITTEKTNLEIAHGLLCIAEGYGIHLELKPTDYYYNITMALCNKLKAELQPEREAKLIEGHSGVYICTLCAQAEERDRRVRLEEAEWWAPKAMGIAPHGTGAKEEECRERLAALRAAVQEKPQGGDTVGLIPPSRFRGPGALEVVGRRFGATSRQKAVDDLPELTQVVPTRGRGGSECGP